MTTLIVEHNVEDFNTWNALFEGHAATRSKFGINNAHVYRGASDPNRVCVIFEAASADAVNNFLQNSDLPDVMEKAGVIGEPTIHILNESTVAAPA